MEGSACGSGTYSAQYGIWILGLLILILILLVAIVWSLENVAQDLKKKVLIPIQQSMANIESNFASTESRVREMGNRLQTWEQLMRNTVDVETVEKGKLALDNLAFKLMR